MKKRTTSLALVLIGTPAILAGCGGGDECDPNRDEGCTRQNGRAGYYGHGGAGAFRGGSGSTAGRSTRGGFGGFGGARGFFGG